MPNTKPLQPDLIEFRANIDESFRALMCDRSLRSALARYGVSPNVVREIYAFGFNDGSQWQANRVADFVRQLHGEPLPTATAGAEV